MDANVLIDFCRADKTVLRLISEHVGLIHVPLPVLREEVDEISGEDCDNLGVVAVDPPLETATLAATRRAGLSFYDHLCLLLARDNGWTCVTNDGRLRRECDVERVPVLWGLEALALLVESGGLPAADGAKLGHAIRHENPYYITEKVLKGFLERIGVAVSKGGRPKR